MNCIDWDDLESSLMYGAAFADDVFQSLNVILVPCNYVGQFGQHTIPPNCNFDLQSQKEYVSQHLHVGILYNSERLDLQNFGEATIVKESHLLDQSFNGNET